MSAPSPTAEHAPTEPPSAAADHFARDMTLKGFARLDMSGDPNVIALCDSANEDLHFYGEAGFNRVQDAWRRSPAVKALIGLERVVKALEDFYGAKPFPFQTLSFHQSAEQTAHADTIHFTAEPVQFLCAVWLALEDVSPDAGPVFVYPGSHREPVMSLADSGAPPGLTAAEAYPKFYEPAILHRVEAGGYPRETLLARKGEAFVWAGNLTYGDEKIIDRSLTRRSLLTHYFFEGCDYYTLMTSPPGRRRRRLPSDARTGRFVWPQGGMPELRTMAFEAWARLVNRVYPYPG